MNVVQGEILSIIGPNGAGKTSVFNCITGFYRATSGDIRFKGQSLLGLPPYSITRFGIARTFQGVRLFQNLTVLENVMIARYCRTKTGVVHAAWRSRLCRQEEGETLEAALGILNKLGLTDDCESLAKSLPYGAQRKLEIARALMSSPQLLLLDEPGAGLNASEKRELVYIIRQIRESGVTVVLIEHDMGLVMGLSDRIVVLNYGEKICEGCPEDVKSDKAVIEAYLGRNA